MYIHAIGAKALKSQISKWGNSLAVRLPRHVVQALDLKPGRIVDLHVNNGSLKLVPVREAEVQLRHLLDEMDRLGGSAEPTLIDSEDRGAEVIDDDYAAVKDH